MGPSKIKDQYHAFSEVAEIARVAHGGNFSNF